MQCAMCAMMARQVGVVVPWQRHMRDDWRVTQPCREGTAKPGTREHTHTHRCFVARSKVCELTHGSRHGITKHHNELRVGQHTVKQIRYGRHTPSAYITRCVTPNGHLPERTSRGIPEDELHALCFVCSHHTPPRFTIIRVNVTSNHPRCLTTTRPPVRFLRRVYHLGPGQSSHTCTILIWCVTQHATQHNTHSLTHSLVGALLSSHTCAHTHTHTHTQNTHAT